MRRPLTKAARARADDTVIISCSLATGAVMQRVSVWSGAPGYDLAPHVDMRGSDMLQDGRPMMRRPMFTTLSDARTKHEFVIVADETLLFRAMQDVDTDKDPKARASIRVYSPRALRVRNFIRNAMRKVFGNGRSGKTAPSQ